MSEAILIYPHQLFKDHEAVAANPSLPIYLIEESLLLTKNPIHRQKLFFHKLSLDAYERYLLEQGRTVHRYTIKDYPTTHDVLLALHKAGVRTLHVADTTDDWLETALTESSLSRVWYESKLFIVKKDEATERFLDSKRSMANFYKKLRQDYDILITDDGAPTGGKWSFDDENRKPLPSNIELPEDIQLFGNKETTTAEEWVEQIKAEKYGEMGCWLPYTHDGAQKFLEEFLRTRFAQFGPYEDAISTTHTRLFHSTLSPLLNVGLLTPKEVLDNTLAYAKTHEAPLQSLEGFIRQLLGWREFMRASYECDGRTMRTSNFFNHSRTLPDSFWNGTTGIVPVDHTVHAALSFGYTHHIERLMVMGNFMLLAQTDPNEVYRWFMGMYVDAYDWVMVPNVYGMSQFADGGSFATKPYISGANYVKKMSNFPKGDWEATWTGLYWNFIDTHKDYFKSNHRLSMMLAMLEKMDDDTRSNHLVRAQNYLN